MPLTHPARPARALVALAAAAVVAAGTLAVAVALRPSEASTDPASLAAPTASVDPGASVDPSAPADAAEVDRQVHQREIFALRSDRAFVEAVATAPDSVDIVWSGLRVTPAEAAELDRQETLGPKLQEMADLLTPLGAFAGMWLENPVAEPQVMAISVVGELDPAVRQRITDIAGADPLRITTATRTHQQLEDIGAALDGTAAYRAGSLTGWGIDETGNTVRVSIDPAAPADTEADLAAELGDALRFTREGPAVADVG